jgi:acetyl-CoA C-acetyltransferase
MTLHPNTPILVGVGQTVSHWDGQIYEQAPSPQNLRHLAALNAITDTGANITAEIECIYIVRTMLDSIPDMPHPFGRCDNSPATLAAALGINNAQLIYSVAGGDQPQALVNEAAEKIYNGTAKVILIAGAEATAAQKTALKNQHILNWSVESSAQMEDRGVGRPLLSVYEINNGLGMPTQTYPAFEHALRARLGNNRADHMRLMSELWAGFSKVAAQNPYAQYPFARSVDFLSKESRDNYRVADPYLKWHVAQDAVNQGAALIVTSVKQATQLGIDPAKWIYLHGYAQATDRLITERVDLSRSYALELALAQALRAAQKNTQNIKYFDLYSCFPCAVLLAAEALELDWRKIPATITGGLSFFGGPGNNYSMHAIATMVEKLRTDTSAFGLISANGGFLSKQAVGIYSAVPKNEWQPVSSGESQTKIDAQIKPILLNESCEAIIETYTVTYTKGQPKHAYVVANNNQGRILARTRDGDTAILHALMTHDLIGKPVTLETEGKINYIKAIMPS